MAPTINYVIRPNKNIERKLIIECLSALAPRFDISDYRYVGMGSFWFVDFVMVHKTLAVEDMISIEFDEHADRAEFNRPLSCIEVKGGDSKDVLPEIPIEDKRAIFWLDYTKGLHGSVLQDINNVCSRAPAGSIIITTVNAHSGQLKNGKDADDNPLSEVEMLRQLVGSDFVPAETRQADLSLRAFPQLLGNILIKRLKRETRLHQPPKEFEILFNFSHEDNSPMVTVGGMIVDDVARANLDQCELRRKFEFFGEWQYPIRVLPFTSKEKITVDRLLPGTGAIDYATARTNLQWNISDDELTAYEKFYRHYPVFGEYQL